LSDLEDAVPRIELLQIGSGNPELPRHAKTLRQNMAPLSEGFGVLPGCLKVCPIVRASEMYILVDALPRLKSIIFAALTSTKAVSTTLLLPRMNRTGDYWSSFKGFKRKLLFAINSISLKLPGVKRLSDRFSIWLSITSDRSRKSKLRMCSSIIYYPVCIK
jgi:hypothetical protein